MTDESNKPCGCPFPGKPHAKGDKGCLFEAAGIVKGIDWAAAGKDFTTFSFISTKPDSNGDQFTVESIKKAMDEMKALKKVYEKKMAELAFMHNLPPFGKSKFDAELTFFDHALFNHVAVSMGVPSTLFGLPVVFKDASFFHRRKPFHRHLVRRDGQGEYRPDPAGTLRSLMEAPEESWPIEEECW